MDEEEQKAASEAAKAEIQQIISALTQRAIDLSADNAVLKLRLSKAEAALAEAKKVPE